MNIPIPKKFVSVMLIVNQQKNHYLQLLEYLTKNDLLDANQQQLETSNIPNLYLVNQDLTGLKIKQVRELIQESAYATITQKPRVIAILNAQQSSSPAQNALLKIIEEPPNNTLIILTTAFPKQLLATIRSRCIIKHFFNPKNNKNNVSEEIIKEAKLLLDPQFNHVQAIKLAEKYKKRENSLTWITQLIDFLHYQLHVLSSVYSTKKITFILKELLCCHQEIQDNFNPQLSLEYHLFQVISKH